MEGVFISIFYPELLHSECIFLTLNLKLDFNFLSVSPCLATTDGATNTCCWWVSSFGINGIDDIPLLVNRKKSDLLSLQLLYERVFVVLISSYFDLMSKDSIRCMFRSYKERLLVQVKISISSSAIKHTITSFYSLVWIFWSILSENWGWTFPIVLGCISV